MLGMRFTEHFIMKLSQRLGNVMCQYYCKDLAWHSWGQKRWCIMSLLFSLSSYNVARKMHYCAVNIGLKVLLRHHFDAWSLSTSMWMSFSQNFPSPLTNFGHHENILFLIIKNITMWIREREFIDYVLHYVI